MMSIEPNAGKQDRRSETATDISVVIPAYNEAKRLPETLHAVEDYFDTRGLSREILIVDDGSQDDTVQICLNLRDKITGLHILRNGGRNRGKGFSVRHGILEASGPFVLMMDADQSSPIEELDKLLPPIRDSLSDIAIGSRALKESQIIVHQPLYREPLGFLYNDIIQLLVLKGIKDTQCGFKLFRREVARDIFSRSIVSGFAFDVEILFIARLLGYRITEIPIRWQNDPNTKVKILRHGINMLADLFRIRWNDWKGLYKSNLHPQ
jgi:dolichyl-phosphate beta-glucosyltransferase